MPRQRLDAVLVARGIAADGRGAFIVVTEGRVFVNGQKAVSPGQSVADGDAIEVRPARACVGRGALKLDAAFERFGVDVAGNVCADVGAATGGFTEVLLKRGAAKVYAIDAGRGKLDLKLRQDPRVVVMEGTNVLTMPPLPEPVDTITIDVSFTSLRLVLPTVRPWLPWLYYSHDRGSSTTKGGRGIESVGHVIALFKPQYEIEDKSLLEHGILRDESARLELVEAFRTWLAERGWRERGFMASPIRGSEGNVEYLWHLVPICIS